MALTVSSLAAYNGKYDKEFYNKLTLSSEILNEVFTLLPNVKNSQNLASLVADSSIIQDADCAWSATGITLTEKKVTVLDKKVTSRILLRYFRANLLL